MLIISQFMCKIGILFYFAFLILEVILSLTVSKTFFFPSIKSLLIYAPCFKAKWYISISSSFWSLFKIPENMIL